MTMKFRVLVNMVLVAGLALPFAGQAWAGKDDKKADQKAAKEAVDPVCGMTVDPATAEKATFKGKTYYFCSLDEKKEFEKTPEKFVGTDKDKKKK